jgi:hypothetical protein
MNTQVQLNWDIKADREVCWSEFRMLIYVDMELEQKAWRIRSVKKCESKFGLDFCSKFFYQGNTYDVRNIFTQPIYRTVAKEDWIPASATAFEMHDPKNEITHPEEYITLDSHPSGWFSPKYTNYIYLREAYWELVFKENFNELLKSSKNVHNENFLKQQLKYLGEQLDQYSLERASNVLMIKGKKNET